MFHICRGLDIPISGKPVNKQIADGPRIKTVAITGTDYNGLKPSMLVQVGDEVKLGQPVFSCKKAEGALFTAPAAGKVVAINRGERRVFQSLVIEVANEESYVEFGKYDRSQLGQLAADVVRKQLLESGMWVSFRARPFSKIPAIDSVPHSIFVTAMDSQPLAPFAPSIINSCEGFYEGVLVLSRLIDGDVHVCHGKGVKLDLPKAGNVKSHEFHGKHPAGNAGTHIHFVDPVNEKKSVWAINYQDVIAIGKLFTTGKLSVERVVSVGGPAVKDPTLVKTRFGADINDLTAGMIDQNNEARVISGSVLSGRKVEGAFGYLGHFHNQVSAIVEGRKREFLGWLLPGLNKFTASRAYLGGVRQGIKPFTTSTNGSDRAMVPIGLYEKVMPLDILPTQLLRAIVTNDVDTALTLGVLELDEEDLALCTFVDPGKVDYGPALRQMLASIEKEG